MILKAAASEPIPLDGDGANVRDWLYFEDDVEALLLAATQGKVTCSYCVGGHGECTYEQVVEFISPVRSVAASGRSPCPPNHGVNRPPLPRPPLRHRSNAHQQRVGLAATPNQ
jgi:nucleoside-diphosphate-sugar epimerase